MNLVIQEKKSNSASETINIAADFISKLEDRNAILILSGDLGTGKTHFTKGIFKGLNFKNYNEITSPTFDLISSYKLNDLIVHHFDLYRLEKLSTEDTIWLNEILNEKSLCIIEWGDRFEFKISKKIYLIKIDFIKEDERNIKIFTN